MATTSALTAGKIKSTLTRHAKDSQRGGETRFLIGAEDDGGALWYTNTYYAAKVTATTKRIGRPVVEQYMAASNLEVAAGVYPVNGTVGKANGSDGPRITGLIPNAEVWADVERVQVAGRFDALAMVGDKLSRMFTAESTTDEPATVIAVNDDYASWLELTAGVITWRGQVQNGQVSNAKPVGGFNDAGELVALVMPIRLS